MLERGTPGGMMTGAADAKVITGGGHTGHQSGVFVGSLDAG